MIWLLFGAPGSGKGTQSALLTKEFGYAHLSTGDVLRENLKSETDLGKKAKTYMDAGDLVPDDLVIAMVADKLSSSQTTVLDGFPRTVLQAKALSAFSKESALDVRAVVFLDVPEGALIERLSGRRVCSECGQVYHQLQAPPQKEGVCDSCGGKVVQRADDSIEAVINRLQVYKSQTAPLEQYYENLDLLKRVDGLGSAQDVFGRVKEIVTGSSK